MTIERGDHPARFPRRARRRRRGGGAPSGCRACAPTEDNPQGPFYVAGAPFRVDIAPGGEPGERLVVTQLCFAGDPSLAGDPLVRQSLVMPLSATRTTGGAGTLWSVVSDVALASV